MSDLHVLVPAPVLGPASWQPVADELTAGPGADRVVLVVHSGAGPFAAQLAAAVPATPAGVAVVFADAGLPAIDGPTPVMDGGFLPYLHMLVDPGAVAAALVSW